MSTDVGIWVDHKRAVVVTLHEGHVATTTVKSEMDGHPRYVGQGGGEKKYEQRHDGQLTKFYEEVITHCGKPDRLFILGPGEARRELRTQVDQVGGLSAVAVDVEAADTLTDAEIVAAVKTHFNVPL